MVRVDLAVLLERGERARRHLVENVEVARLDVGVGSVGATSGVELEHQSAVLRLVDALVVRVGLKRDLLVALPAGLGQLVRAVADRTLAEFLGDRAVRTCLLYTSPSPRDRTRSRMPSSA